MNNFKKIIIEIALMEVNNISNILLLPQIYKRIFFYY